MPEPMLPAVETFVAEMRALFADQSLSEEARWARARDRLEPLLKDESLIARSKTWPESLTVEGRPGNLLFYEDPDYGFVINALIKKPDVKTSVHDHGRSWTLYGVIEGGEKVFRFEAEGVAPGDTPSEAKLREVGEAEVGPGYIDFVEPWTIHAEYNGPKRTVALIVRSEKSGGFIQNRFDPEDGSVDQYHGPTQIPHRLA